MGALIASGGHAVLGHFAQEYRHFPAQPFGCRIEVGGRFVEGGRHLPGFLGGLRHFADIAGDLVIARRRLLDIAHDLGVTRGTVSINLRSLKKRGLVITSESRMVKLSPQGRALVRDIRLKKTQIKSFLVKVLGVAERYAEVDSCKIEHLLSQRTGLRLAHYMSQFQQKPQP